jgi:hypothetical protein
VGRQFPGPAIHSFAATQTFAPADPFLGDSMVDCDNTRFPKLTDEQKTAVLNDLEEQLMWAEFLKQKPISAKIQ